ncbi:hypothetical protein E2L08_14120 [Palleronia sediminis]|uniref:Peptidylprolyl isomerase n=1 Tax=Palleronia sediminis TaxID=2547833 RepID=A0A4R6A2P9_9RHOB|nr:hypothetical protein [Palleronia sediminis]TDL76228.1 hypothetical protein E2L08_14120 [Palleronia sediminis]
MMNRLSTTALALVLAAPLAIAPALAQDAGASQSTGGDAGASTQEMSPDSVVVSVDGDEITFADVLAGVDALPPQIRQQLPPQQLVGIVVNQLVLRELILRDAEAQNLGDDPEVAELQQGTTDRARDNAIAQVYVRRELESATTDDAIQQAYDAIKENAEGEVPPLEAVRPQLEQQLQERALSDLRERLEDGVEIVFYGPDGEPQEVSTGSDDGGDDMDRDDEMEGDVSTGGDAGSEMMPDNGGDGTETEGDESGSEETEQPEAEETETEEAETGSDGVEAEDLGVDEEVETESSESQN